MNKKLLKLIIIFILMTILTSCTSETEVLYKDKLLISGRFCAEANDKIYYFSNEQDGINGIYQMNHDGSGVELLIEIPDIRRLTVFEDNI